MFGLFILKRLSYMVLTLIGISILIFVLTRVLPGDPARLALGPEASEEQVQDLRHALRLDRSLPVQYVWFLQNLAHGKLGKSLVTHRDVAKDILQRFPATLELVLVSLGLAVIIGVPLGIVSALHKDRVVDYVARSVAFTGISFPRFWIGIMLQLAVAYRLGLLPVTGRMGGLPPPHVTGLFLLDSLIALDFTAFGDAAIHLILPAITLSLSPLAQITRLVRANMVEQIHKDYVTVNRTIGMPETLLVYKYMLKNAFNATLTTVGLMLGWMLGNAFLVEQVFSWPGIARYGINSVLRNDFNAIVAVTLVVGLGYLVINFVVDLLYRVLDPRISLEK
jgi:peptide/nickel transport system permease protein